MAMKASGNDPIWQRCVVLMFLWLAVVSCCALAGGTERASSRRSAWEVRRAGDGVFRAYCVLLANRQHHIVRVSVTPKRRKDWAGWITAGSPGAESRITWVFDPDTGRAINRYDHLKEQRLGAPEQGQAPMFERQGKVVARGDGAYPPGNCLVDELLRRPKIWTGFYARKKALDTPASPATVGLAPYAIGVESLVERAGMTVGDVVVKVWPWPYDHGVMQNYNEIKKGVKDRFLVGDPARVEYLRALPDGGWELVRKKLEWPGIPGMGHQPSKRLVEFEQRWTEHAATPERTLLDLMAAQTGRQKDNADLLRRLGRVEASVDRYRLPGVYIAHRLPMAMPRLAEDYTDTIPAVGTGDVANLMTWLNDIYLRQAEAPPDPMAAADYKGKDLKTHLDCIERVLEEAAGHAAKAFEALSDEEMRFIRTQADDLMAGFLDAHMMCFDDDMDRQRANVRLLGLAHKMDMTAMLRQAMVAARIADDRFLASLKSVMEKKSRSGRIATRDTKWGRIVLAGTADDRYVRENHNPAVLIDLGGDDFYANNTGSSVPGEVPTGILVDFAGNDRYENWKSMRQGCGFFGVGMLVDLEGDDSYVGIRCAQGTGFMGVGVLIDGAGNDTYRGMDHCQGVGQFGAGLLIDEAGDNRFEGRQACQGVGFTWGVGLVRSAGRASDDEYFNKGKVASGYRDRGSFEGWGQGFGCGHRPFASGGLGLLVDEGGDDDYEGGTFSLGGGYYYGLGILRDRSGSDSYRGSRYNMGFTAHQAAGVFIDDAGDDHYATSHYVALGMAWDESCTVFLDRAGDDEYVAPGFALGAAAMNGFALFQDRAGVDRYVGAKAAGEYGNHYHGGTSIGMFMDLGPDEDAHSRGRENGDLRAGPEHAFFIDAPSIQDALRRLRETPLNVTEP